MNKDNKCNTIHETYLRDIMDIYDGLKDAVKTGKVFRGDGPMAGSGNRSLSKMSSNLTMVFPVICSRGISIERSSIISKAIEKNAATMLQRMFTSWQIADSGVESVQDYIRQFHTNLSSRAISLDDIFKESDIDESPIDVPHIVINALKEDAKNLNYYLPTSVNENSLNNFMVREGATVPAPSDKGKNNTDGFKSQITDTDFKKANELMPTTMLIRFSVKDPVTSQVIVVDNAAVGVKAKLYPISSNEVVTNIADKTADRNWLTNFFRATTREISFMKDFILGIDKAKIDAMSASTRNNTTDKMWKVLERRALNSRLKRALKQNNSAAAITTLCISQEEVEYMNKNFNTDVEKISNAIGLFESLNLMCICIVDENLEVAKFLYDEDEPMWEPISFTHLEREASDNTYKKVVNLMTKVNR